MMQAQVQSMTNEQPLWTPTQEFISQTNMAAFMDFVKDKTGQSFDDYNSLWNWSVENTETFWDMIWDFCGVIGDKGDTILADADKMPGAKFYPNGRVNFAENLLRRRD